MGNILGKKGRRPRNENSDLTLDPSRTTSESLNLTTTTNTTNTSSTSSTSSSSNTCNNSNSGNSKFDTKTEKNDNKFKKRRKFTTIQQPGVGKKILLLGTGDSGKSTIVKQCIKTYDKKQIQREKLKDNSKFNLMESMWILVREAEKGASKESFAKLEASPCYQQFQQKKDYNAFNIAQSYDDQTFEMFQQLWKHEAIQEVYAKNYQIFDFIETTNYWMENMERICEKNYTLTIDDYLHQKMKTTGINENDISICDRQVRLVDVGGQRNERKKWPNAYSNVSSVMVVISLSEYDQILYEDPSKNRTEESMDLLNNLLSHPLAKQVSSFFLVFTKKDIFMDKIKQRDLSVSLPFVPEALHLDKTPLLSKEYQEQSLKFVVQQFVDITRQHLTNFSDNSVYIINAIDNRQVTEMMEEISEIVHSNKNV